MAYVKTQWVNDSPPDINAENLNKMEQGIADAQYPDNGTDGQVLKKTSTGVEWADESGGGTASDITYDNTDSGLTATDVQDAIDETVSALNTGLSSAVKSVNTETPDANGNVSLNAEDIPAEGMGSKDVSGNPIIITDGVAENAQNLSVELEPIQDLHGYDKPWVGGAGKNLAAVTATSQTISGVTFTINTDNGGNVIGITANGTATDLVIYNLGTYTITTAGNYVLSGCPSNGSASTFYLDCRRDDSSQAIDVGNGVTFASNGQSGKQVRVVILSGVQMNNEVFYPMICLASDTDHTFEPYSNICPISGRTQVNVTRTGKNLYIGSPSFDGYTNSGWTKSEETYNNHEVYYCTQAWSRLYKEISVIAGKTYTFSAMVKANVDVPVYIYPQIVRTDAQFDKDFVKCFANQTWSRISGTFTAVTSGIAKIRAELSSEATLYVSEYQLEEGSTATSYEPYTGQTVTVALGQTVYGGTLDVTTGELVVDRAIVEYDGSSDELWGVYSPFSGFYINNPLMVRSYRSSGLSNWLKVFKRGDDPARGIWNGVDDNMHYILYVFELCGASSADSASEILAKWKTYLASNPLQITFLLATPQTIQLTAQQLALLEGYNILTTDGDTINLRYIGTEASDVQAEIDEFENVTYKLTTSIAPIEQTTAIATHAVGDYIMLNGEFCKVISAIAVGETITIGTNVSRTTIADELKAIIAQLGA